MSQPLKSNMRNLCSSECSHFPQTRVHNLPFITTISGDLLQGNNSAETEMFIRKHI